MAWREQLEKRWPARHVSDKEEPIGDEGQLINGIYTQGQPEAGTPNDQQRMARRKLGP